MHIQNENQLRELYGFPKGRAEKKVLTALDPHAINFISKSPFLVMSSVNKLGHVDASPRGGVAGFVKVTDDLQVIIPDAKGNNRLDSLVNIIETSRVGLLFFLPGIDETLRINGSAILSTDIELISLFTGEKNIPKSCIVISVEESFLHCAKALMRSKLWKSETQLKRKDFPSMGQMLKDQIGGSDRVESHEEMVKRYQKDL